MLRSLAASQARERDDAEDAEPGKIVHETREGEMAALGEVPFGRYYGSVDATPLFVVLARDYWARTADRATIDAVWPAIERALSWIDEYGDADGDGFVEYARHTPHGLLQQGWKDSSDSVFHADGRLAGGPVALCEVQGYAYAARLAGAQLASLRGDRALAARLEERAAELERRFAERFWWEDAGTYALALDGDKRPCRVRTSNAGHCLWSGIARAEHAEAVMATMMDDAMFSGWGVRTVATTEARYDWIEIKNLAVGSASIDLLLRRARADVAIEVLDKRGNASVIVTKTV